MIIPNVSAYNRKNDQTTLLPAYVDNQLYNLQLKYKDVPIEKLKELIKSIIEKEIKRPKLKQIVHKSYGNSDFAETDLLTYTSTVLAEQIVTPFGTVYYNPSIKKSFIKQFIQSKIADRKRVKNSMLDHEAKGEVSVARIENSIQSRIKIGVNSISGAMASAFNCLFDPAGYNAITSTCRHGCMTGYAHTERFLEGNFYLTSYEDIVNWCILLCRKCPTEEQLKNATDTYSLKIPSIDDLYMHFYTCLALYTYDIPTDKIKKFLSTLSQTQITFIYYAFNLKHVFKNNDHTFKKYIDYLFEPVELTNIDPDLSPKELYSVDGDLLIMVTAIYPELLEGHLVYDTIKDAPDAAKRIITFCKIIIKKIAELQLLFDTFVFINVDIPNINNHKNMLRKTVILSDTDSVIASTKSWVEWRQGCIEYTPRAYQINFLIIYLITKSLSHVFAVMSTNIGMVSEDLRLINMKNEFFYPIMLRTPIAKHYIGINTIKEGRWLSKPKLDIKGKNFRGSDLSTTTLSFIKKFITTTFDDYMRDGSLSGAELIKRVVEFEYDIMDSIDNQETTYFGTSPINPPETYKIPDQSAYFYYQFWQEVFAQKYDNIYVPQKCRKIPIFPKLIRSQEFLDRVKKIDNALHDRLVVFLRKWPKKNITQFYIPLHIKLPKEIIPAIDVRHIIQGNLLPLYIILRSFGIGVMFKNKIMLLSDIYQLREPNTISKQE